MIRERLSKGEAHYREEYLLLEMMESFSSDRGKQAGIVIPEVEDRRILDPTAIRSLLTPKVPLSSINTLLQLVSFLLALYHHGIPLSVFWKWCYVNKNTVLRWIVGLGLEIWPIVYKWIKKQVVNDPLGCLLGLQNVNKYKKMARNEVTQYCGP